MNNSDNGPTPPDELPESLVQRVDALERRELKSLHSYVERRIKSLRSPLEAAIEANAAGEIVDIEKHGTYALVRLHPPDPEGDGVRTETTSLYHVRRDRLPDGTESLDWAYIGDIQNPESAE